MSGIIPGGMFSGSGGTPMEVDVSDAAEDLEKITFDEEENALEQSSLSAEDLKKVHDYYKELHESVIAAERQYGFSRMRKLDPEVGSLLHHAILHDSNLAIWLIQNHYNQYEHVTDDEHRTPSRLIKDLNDEFFRRPESQSLLHLELIVRQQEDNTQRDNTQRGLLESYIADRDARFQQIWAHRNHAMFTADGGNILHFAVRHNLDDFHNWARVHRRRDYLDYLSKHDNYLQTPVQLLRYLRQRSAQARGDRRTRRRLGASHDDVPPLVHASSGSEGDEDTRSNSEDEIPEWARRRVAIQVELPGGHGVGTLTEAQTHSIIADAAREIRRQMTADPDPDQDQSFLEPFGMSPRVARRFCRRRNAILEGHRRHLSQQERGFSRSGRRKESKSRSRGGP